MPDRKLVATQSLEQHLPRPAPRGSANAPSSPAGGTVGYEQEPGSHVALAATVAVPSSGVRAISAAPVPLEGGGTLPFPVPITPEIADVDGATLQAPGQDMRIIDTTAALRSTLSRSAVLPRVEVAGEEAKLILDTRARYEESRVLGAGGVGEVVEALDNDIGRTVALKRLLPEMRAPATLVRFIDEIRTIGGLEHPNIVPIHDVGVDTAGQYYFVMKYVQGETLESIIDKLAKGDPEYHRKYTIERRVQIFTGILDAIHYAHARGYIHRDIKPANVMVGPYGEVMVMDWGLAKKIRGPDTASLPGRDASAIPGEAAGKGKDSTSSFTTAVGSIVGTPAYMSPEQAMGGATPIDERSDTYSLCVLFYELLTLRHYLSEHHTIEEMLDAVIHEKPASVEFAKNPHQELVPSELSWFLTRGLEKNPADRYQSVTEMIERLDRRRDGDIPIQCPITCVKQVTNRWMRFVDRHPLAVVGGMTFVALFLLAGMVYGAVRLVMVGVS